MMLEFQDTINDHDHTFVLTDCVIKKLQPCKDLL